MKLKQFLQGIPFLAWVVIYTAFCWGMFAAILGSVTPELRQELGNYQALGWLMTAWASGSIVGAMQGGRLAQRLAARKLFLNYCGLALLALLLIVFASNVWLLMIGFFCIAILEAALVTLGHSILARVYAEPQARGRVLSLVDVAFSAGNLATPLVVIGLQNFSDSWRLPYQLFFIPLIAALVLFWSHRPTPGESPQAGHAGGITASTAIPAAIQPMSYLQLLRKPVLAWSMAAGMLGGFMEWAQYFWYVSYGIDVQHLSPNAARISLQFFIAGMVASRCWQAFWHSSWTLQQKLWRLNLLALAGLALTVLLPTHGWMPAYALGNFLFGLGNGVVFPALLAVMINHVPSQAARLSALLMIGFTLGAQMAGAVLGFTADWLGVHAAYSALLVAAVGFVAVTWYLRQATGQLPTQSSGSAS
jgi:MFS family permease